MENLNWPKWLKCIKFIAQKIFFQNRYQAQKVLEASYIKLKAWINVNVYNTEKSKEITLPKLFYETSKTMISKQK